MRPLASLGLTLVLSTLAPSEVFGAGDEPSGKSPTEEPSKPPEKKPQTATSLGHGFQFGFGVRAGTGYRVVMPYEEENCGETDESGEPKSVCGGRQPFWLELSPSFGLLDSLELLVDVRLILEEDFSGSTGLFVAPGIKYYTDPEDIFKLFFTGQVVLESQEQKHEPGLSSFDIGIRSVLGLQFDVLRYVGLFAQGGIIIGFKRWLTFTVDFAGGVQIRY